MTFSLGGVPFSKFRLEANPPPPMTSIVPPIFRPGGGPAFLGPIKPEYLELSLVIATGIVPRPAV